MYSYSGCCLISHYSKLIAGKLGGKKKRKKKKHIWRQRSQQSWQQTAFLSRPMWGSDEYDGFPVINQTTACLSLGWPPVKDTLAPPAGVSEGPQQILPKPPFFPPSSFLPLLLPPPPLLTAITPRSRSPSGDEALPLWRC